MDKRLKQNIFIVIIALLAMSFLVFSFIYREPVKVSVFISNFLFWSLLAIVAETFLIISPSGIATSVAPAVYIYISLVSDPFTVISVIIIGCIFRFPEIEGEKKHILNTKLNTSVFNMSNLTLSLGTCAWVIELANLKLNLFLTVPLVIIAFMSAELINFILVAILLKYSQDIKPMLVFKSMLKTFPSTVAIGMLGIFLASVSGDDGNKVIVLVFFIPLLLARYSFKLYFESQRMALDTIHALNEALHAKDAYTGTHTGRVEQYAVDLAGAYGLPAADCELIRTAALLHDIGKIGIPDDILNKPGRLTRDEFERIQEHSSIGAKILGNVNSLKRVSQIIVQHHERYDGSGYPNRLKGDEIAIEAAILMVSDSYDAMTTDRPYRKALSKAQAISELQKFSGTQFHPMLAKCFIEGVLNHDEEFDTVEEPSISSELLVKTREILEAGVDFPHDALSKETEAMLLEDYIKSETSKDKRNHEVSNTMTRKEKLRQHPIRIAKESR